jgi:hypothetical protein
MSIKDVKNDAVDWMDGGGENGTCVAARDIFQGDNLRCDEKIASDAKNQKSYVAAFKREASFPLSKSAVALQRQRLVS